MAATTVILTDEKFKDIYTDEKFRNEVAYAHQCMNSQGKFKHHKTCSYPIDYIVTEEQIRLAEEERQKGKKLAIEKAKNKLVFIGMGSSYAPRFEGDVCNHRIRTEFTNMHGNRFFIEICRASRNEDLHITHSIDRTKQDLLEDAHDKQGEFYNCKDLERNVPMLKYTFHNVRDLINEKFDCRFKEIYVDEHNLTTDDIICESPKS